MCLRYHACQLLIYLLISGITHKSHDRKRQSVEYLSVFNQGIAALRAEKFLNCQIHVMIIVPDHDQIV